MANSTADSPAMAERYNNSTPIKRVQLCSPVRTTHSANIGEKQRTPLSQIHRFVHSGVQLLATTPGKNLRTPECASGSQLVKDRRTHFLTPLSVNSNLQVGMIYTALIFMLLSFLKLFWVIPDNEIKTGSKEN